MSMEGAAWTSLYHAMHATDERRPFSIATLRRIAAFARPHRRHLVLFLLLSVAGALLAVRHRCWPAGWSTRSSAVRRRRPC